MSNASAPRFASTRNACHDIGTIWPCWLKWILVIRLWPERALLADVVKHKKVFYSASYARYDDCLSGQMRLLPDAAGCAALQWDFDRMIAAGMFIGPAPSFAWVMARLQTLEAEINAGGGE